MGEFSNEEIQVAIERVIGHPVQQVEASLLTSIPLMIEGDAEKAAEVLLGAVVAICCMTDRRPGDLMAAVALGTMTEDDQWDEYARESTMSLFKAVYSELVEGSQDGAQDDTQQPGEPES